MKTLDINGSVEQKLAAVAFTEKLRDYFKLHPHTMARDVKAGAKKAKITPIEMVEAFEKILPEMMSEAIAATKTILLRELPSSSSDLDEHTTDVDEE